MLLAGAGGVTELSRWRVSNNYSGAREGPGQYDRHQTSTTTVTCGRVRLVVSPVRFQPAPAHQFQRVNPIMRAQAMSMIFGLKNGSFFSTWRSLLHASTPRCSKAPVKGGLWLSAASARLILLPGLPRPGSLACAASKTGWRGPPAMLRAGLFLTVHRLRLINSIASGTL